MSAASWSGGVGVRTPCLATSRFILAWASLARSASTYTPHNAHRHARSFPG